MLARDAELAAKIERLEQKLGILPEGEEPTK